ncbi:MAG: YraN family protein [Firmicutes bacterium]|nr:YraN family protein [Bacillota bacterium]
MIKTFNKITGNQGEAIAISYLEKNRFQIIETNFKLKFGEIDIIAIKPNKQNETVYHFVEVKYRKSDKFGTGLDAVTSTKQRTIHRVATAYLLNKNLYNKVNTSFDVIAIMGQTNDYTIDHLEGCF